MLNALKQSGACPVPKKSDNTDHLPAVGEGATFVHLAAPIASEARGGGRVLGGWRGSETLPRPKQIERLMAEAGAGSGFR